MTPVLLLQLAAAFGASALVSWLVTGIVWRAAVAALEDSEDGWKETAEPRDGRVRTAASSRSPWRSAAVVGLMFLIDFIWLGAVFLVSSRSAVLLAAAGGLLGTRFVLLANSVLRGANTSS